MLYITYQPVNFFLDLNIVFPVVHTNVLAVNAESWKNILVSGKLYDIYQEPYTWLYLWKVISIS